MTKQQKTTKTLVMTALFIAMSVIGAYIKIPNPVTSSIALDALPAYLSALVLGGIPGAAVGALGHLISAAAGGFPMSLPIHLLIATEMAIIMVIFSIIAKKINLIAALVAGIILNGVVSPAVLILIPGFGLPVFIGALLPLIAASTVNVLVSGIVYHSIKDIKIVKEFAEVNHGV